MKISRLSSTEVVNAAVLPIEKRSAYLQSIETPKVFWNYNPIHAELPKLLQSDSGLFGSLPPDNEGVLVERIRRSCTACEAQENACVAVARAIIDWQRNTGAVGRVVHPEPFRTTVDTLRYCADVAVVLEGELYVINLDPRSSMTLSVEGKEFIKSLIHHTALIGDLRSAKAALLSTPKVGNGNRKAVFECLSGPPKYAIDDLMHRVVETYSIWETILRARVREAAKEN